MSHLFEKGEQNVFLTRRARCKVHFFRGGGSKDISASLSIFQPFTPSPRPSVLVPRSTERWHFAVHSRPYPNSFPYFFFFLGGGGGEDDGFTQAAFVRPGTR